MRRASHQAVAQFWCFLQDFVEQRYAPEEWRAVSATHPFFQDAVFALFLGCLCLWARTTVFTGTALLLSYMAGP